jgi:hypothetical protein
MTTQRLLAPLRRPDWATDRLVDESHIEYARPMGSVATAHGDDPAIEVVVIQQDHLDLTAEPPTIERQQPEIRLGGVRMTEAQVRELVAILSSGADLASAAGDQVPA